MNPRAELEKEISTYIRESFHKGFDSESVTELDNFDGFAEAEEAISHYAIGRWVPVEERLPENGVKCLVKGHDDGLFCADHFCNGIWDKYGYEPTITHWLELDLPSGKEEA